MKIYWAYGSNLNVDNMRDRCPAARVISKLTVPGLQLVFRGVADVVNAVHCDTPGGLWEISERDERSLDAYEGVKGGVYLKNYFRISMRHQGTRKEYRVLIYVMNVDRGILPPSERYYETIKQGYADFGLDVTKLEEALRNSYKEKNPTRLLRARQRARGDFKLAQLPQQKEIYVDP